MIRWKTLRTRRAGRISRRAFLGGAGAVLTLPVLESMFGEKVAQADDAFPARTLMYYVPCGIHMAGFTPAETGAGYSLTPILTPLANVREKLNIISGLSNQPAESDGAGDHASGTSGFLTCAHANKSETEIQLGISMDQVIANAIGDQTRIPSMQIGIDGGGNTGGCDSGYSCAYTRNISWASAEQPLSKATSPRVVFNQIFEGADPEATEAEKARRKAYRLSVLDYVNDEAVSLQSKLGADDRAKLDEYLTGVRELEQRINKPAPTCEPIAEPGDDLGYVEKVDMMIELMVLAFRCDATRVISFMMANAGSNRTFSFLGVNSGHHQLSHHGGNAGNHANLQTINTFEVQKFAELLEKMDAVTEGTGTLLDHSQLFFSSEIEDGDAHRHHNLPVILAGGCHGAYTTGRHVAYTPATKDGEPMANLFIKMIQAGGAPDVTTFGDDGTGPLDGLS